MREKIIECCEGCRRITPEGECSVYPNPLAIWNIGKNVCPMSTIGKKVITEEKKMNPLKASRRAKKGIK